MLVGSLALTIPIRPQLQVVLRQRLLAVDNQALRSIQANVLVIKSKIP